VFPLAAPIRNDRLTQRYRRRDIELGGDVMRPFAGGGLKIIGLMTRRVRDDEDVSLLRIDDLLGGSAQTIDDHRDETLARIVWTRPRLFGWSVELGAEGALNRLDSNVNLFALNAAGDRTRIDLPVDQAVVKEYRGEVFINIGRALTGTLRTDLGLTYETSRLTVTGDAEAERSLRFLKPKMTFDWRPAGGWRFQVSVQRTVAQLRFEDFISGAELTNDRVNGGNADLVPQRAWQTLLTAERSLWGDGLFRLEAGYNRISLVQDRIPTPEGFDAPGNLGDGKEMILRSRIDAPLARFGIEGGRLTLYGSYVKSSVVDPYTFRDRLFSGNSLFYFEVKFRQDLGKFAWGVNLDGGTASTWYRLDEEDRNWSKIPYVTAFAEYRPDSRMTITAGLDNATGVPGFRRRTFYEPNRASLVPVAIEYRQRNRHIMPYLTVKRSF
jgi:hypothetical protein